MDKVTHYNFQGYTLQDLFKGRDCLVILFDEGFFDDTTEDISPLTMLQEINEEIKRRSI